MNKEIEIMIARTHVMIQQLDQLLFQIEAAVSKSNRHDVEYTDRKGGKCQTEY